MSNLLVPVYRGEIEVVRAGSPEKEFYKWGCKHNGLDYDPTVSYPNFYDSTSSEFCYHEHFQFMVNEKLRNGYVIVGIEGNDGWLFTKAENIIP